MLNKLDKPIHLTLYFSDKTTAELPQLRTYAERVRELLIEYQRASSGMVIFSEKDPEPFSEIEDQASAAGLQGVAASAGGNMVYFGLSAELESVELQAEVRSGLKKDFKSELKSELKPELQHQNKRQDKALETVVSTGVRLNPREIIAFFSQEREAFLEYDISQLIYRLSQSKIHKLGVLSDLPLLQTYRQSQQPDMGWLAVQQLKNSFELKKLSHDIDRVDTDIDLLLLVHPAELGEKTLYAIDQYILAGGAAMIFVDPNAEMVAASPMAGPAPYPSDLSRLLRVWGVDYDSEWVVADARWGLPLPAGSDGVVLPHIGILGLQEMSINRDDRVSAELERINLSSAGFLNPLKSATTVFTALLSSSKKSEVMKTTALIEETSHARLLKDFSADDKVYTLMARIRGSAKTAFPEGLNHYGARRKKPNDSELNNKEFNGKELNKNSSGLTKKLSGQHYESGNINIIVAADTDMLSDRLWVQVSDFFGHRVAAPWANNGDLLLNLAESLVGSRDLIGLRSRGLFSRPFTVIESLQQTATDRYRLQEKALITQLSELEQQLELLQPQASADVLVHGDGTSDTEDTLTDQQRQDLFVFEEKRLYVRKQLRQVQHQLNQDIELLQRYLKLINFLAVPILFSLLLLGMCFYRRSESK